MMAWVLILTLALLTSPLLNAAAVDDTFTVPAGGCVGDCSSTVIWEENFDSLPDWGPSGSLRCRYFGDPTSNNSDPTPDCEEIPAAVAASFPMIYCSDSNPTNPGGEIMSGIGRGGSKALRNYDESNGDANSWGSECQWFATSYPTEYPELWVEYYMKANPDMAVPAAAKIIHFGHYWDDVINGTTGTSISNTNNGALSPYNTTSGFYIANFREESAGMTFSIGPRGNSSYHVYAKGACVEADDPTAQCTKRSARYYIRDNFPTCGLASDLSWGGTIGDGNWHKIEWRFVMSSGTDTNDGIAAVYYDDCLQGIRTNANYKNGTPRPDSIGANVWTVGGNMNNVWAGDTNAEQWTYDLDDIRVCTERCP